MADARVWLGVAVLASVALAGCLTGSDPVDPAALAAAQGLGPVAPQLRLLDGEDGARSGGGFEMHVPVDVVLVGFDAGVAEGLRERLVPEPIEHNGLDYHRNLPPDPATPTEVLPTASEPPLPVLPWAHYRVVEAPAAFAQEAWAFLAEHEVADPTSDVGTVYDGNAFEAWLVEALPRHGIPVDANAPPFVVLHGGEALPASHAWRYSYLNGWLEPVRVIGGKLPVLVMDTSAVADPWVSGDQPYLEPLARDGDATLGAVEQAARDAVHTRLLQGPIYPVSTKPCHAITLVYAIRSAALTEHLPGMTRADEMLDAEALERAFENVTGPGTVHVDVTVLRLPVDDPALDALVRVKQPTLDHVRLWLDMHWQDYWVPHDGCEPYVSLLVFGDAADGPSAFGIAMYDVQKSHRISFSHVSGLIRGVEEFDGPLRDLILGPRSPSRFAMDWVNFLYSHETGHLLGLMHPHNIIRDDGANVITAFSSVWSAMSYQTGDRTLDFGALDRVNLQRARAAYLVQAAMEHGHTEAPEFQQAWQHLEARHWATAADVLQGLVHGDMGDHAHGGGAGR